MKEIIMEELARLPGLFLFFSSLLVAIIIGAVILMLFVKWSFRDSP